MEDIDALKAVDLDGYARSPGWQGYSESRGPFEWSDAVRVAKRVLQIMRDTQEPQMLLSSMHTDTGRPDLHSPDHARLTPLIDAGLIRLVDYSKFESPLALEEAWQVGHDIAWGSIRSMEMPQTLDADVAQLFAAKMCLHEAMGHCFVWLRDRGLLVYPHDDGGVGVIAAVENADRDLARLLLKAAGPTHHLANVDAAPRAARP